MIVLRWPRADAAALGRLEKPASRYTAFPMPHAARPLTVTASAVLAFGVHCSSSHTLGAVRAEGPTPQPTVLGRFEPGPLGAITDVPGVEVGHFTLVEGESIRTGVTAILPHDGNIFAAKVPAAIVVANGFGKLVGFTQVRELGELETPLLLTNTLQVWDAAAALVTHTLSQPGNAEVRSVNPVVGETNDGWLNDIRRRPLRAEHFAAAMHDATTGPVEEGAVGAGTGTRALGFKGGIGTASRVVGPWTLGVLVQTNFGGSLVVAGVPVGQRLAAEGEPDRDGSCMIVIATDAPLDARQLERLAKRSFVGMARTGASFSHGSGDYAIAFSTLDDVDSDGGARPSRPRVPDAQLSPLFEAVADATEVAIVNSLVHASTTRGHRGHTAEALPVERARALLRERGFDLPLR